MKALEVQNLVKNYSTKDGGYKEALKSINLTVNQGDFFGLLGPNGAGKSTLINIMASIVKKTSGTVIINGFDIDIDENSAKNSIGIVTQDVYFDPFFTVREALEIYAGYYGIPSNKRKTDEIMDILGLTDKANVKPRGLSGGMKRRLLIAKALVHSPKILVLDEPSAGVDIELREKIWSYVKELNKQGTTIILTTHYLEEAEKMCDKIAIINKGIIVACDKKTNLLNSVKSDEILFSFKNNLTTIPECLRQFEARLLGQDKVAIKFNKKTADISKILSTVHNFSDSIIDIETRQAKLEDVFKHLINS